MKWDFIYDEEIPDEFPNYIGVISNGKDLLFYHAYYLEEDKPICDIYDSLREFWMYGETNMSYEWSAENDEKFVNFLNSLPENAIVHGDDSDLLNFKPNEML